MITIAQKAALQEVAKAFGWDKEPIDKLGIILWSLFQYYTSRLDLQ